MRSIEERLAKLEEAASSARMKQTFFYLLGAMTVLIGTAVANSTTKTIPEIRTRKIVVVDSNNTPRIEIQEDDEGTERISRGAGVFIYDAQGNERGGFGTLANGTAALVLDAPKGIGSEMPDRAMMGVLPDGTSLIGLNANTGEGAVFLRAGATDGTIEISGQSDRDNNYTTRTLTHRE